MTRVFLLIITFVLLFALVPFSWADNGSDQTVNVPIITGIRYNNTDYFMYQYNNLTFFSNRVLIPTQSSMENRTSGSLVLDALTCMPVTPQGLQLSDIPGSLYSNTPLADTSASKEQFEPLVYSTGSGRDKTLSIEVQDELTVKYSFNTPDTAKTDQKSFTGDITLLSGPMDGLWFYGYPYSYGGEDSGENADTIPADSQLVRVVCMPGNADYVVDDTNLVTDPAGTVWSSPDILSTSDIQDGTLLKGAENPGYLYLSSWSGVSPWFPIYTFPTGEISLSPPGSGTQTSLNELWDHVSASELGAGSWNGLWVGELAPMSGKESSSSMQPVESSVPELTEKDRKMAEAIDQADEAAKSSRDVLDAYNAAIQDNPDNWAAHLTYARIMFKYHANGLAEKAAREVLRINPGNTEAQEILTQLGVSP